MAGWFVLGPNMGVGVLSTCFVSAVVGESVHATAAMCRNHLCSREAVTSTDWRVASLVTGGYVTGMSLSRSAGAPRHTFLSPH